MNLKRRRITARSIATHETQRGSAKKPDAAVMEDCIHADVLFKRKPSLRVAR